MARFTAANARDMAAKSHAARRQRLASGEPAVETFPQTSQVSPHEAPHVYVNLRLSRVRVQLDLVDKRITEQAKKPQIDGQVLNWLCSAQERLAEQERILAGRPLPGSRRPGSDRSDRRRPPSGIIDEPVLQPAAPLVPPANPAPAATAPTKPPMPPAVLVTIEEATRRRPPPLPTLALPSQKPG